MTRTFNDYRLSITEDQYWMGHGYETIFQGSYYGRESESLSGTDSIKVKHYYENKEASIVTGDFIDFSHMGYYFNSFC